ncbi:MAG: hypothetical protein IKB65_02770 [Ruminiclostridium sp.]|nr:hypothetical protein [Ruminiclostridium sp.]
MVGEKTSNNAYVNETKSEDNEYSSKREVKIHKHTRFVLAEVEKERIDNLQKAVEEAEDNVSSGWIKPDVLLGFSTAFFGGFIGSISQIVEMVNTNEITSMIFLYFVLLLISVFLFFFYLNAQRKKHVTVTALISTMKRETDSIVKSLTIPDNDFSKGSTSNDLGNLMDDK